MKEIVFKRRNINSNSTNSTMSNKSDGMPAFGPMKYTNKNWTNLLTEMTAWRQDNSDKEWLPAQQFANSVNSFWGNFATQEFWYRYSKAKPVIDKKLGCEYVDSITIYIDAANNFYLTC